MRTMEFNLEDFLQQLRQLKKMGSLTQLVELVPGFSKLASSIPQGGEERHMRKIEAIILSMTPEERYNPAIVNGSRRRRIAQGS